jgi:predicted nuclease with TOPRIM domain
MPIKGGVIPCVLDINSDPDRFDFDDEVTICRSSLTQIKPSSANPAYTSIVRVTPTVFRRRSCMSDREQSIEKAKAKLDEWNAEIDKMKAKADEAEADSKAEYEKQLNEMRSKRDEAEAKLKEMREASDDAWDDMKSGFDKMWDSMSDAFRSAMSRFK